MNSRYLIALAVMATLPIAVVAQPTRLESSDPAAAVPQPQYESSFRDYQRWREPQESPAKTWRATNADVTKAAPGMPVMNTDQASSDTSPMPHRYERK